MLVQWTPFRGARVDTSCLSGCFSMRQQVVYERAAAGLAQESTRVSASVRGRSGLSRVPGRVSVGLVCPRCSQRRAIACARYDQLVIRRAHREIGLEVAVRGPEPFGSSIVTEPH